MMAEDRKTKRKMRADQLLVEKGLAADIKMAASLILAGKVIADDQRVDHAGTLLKYESILRLKGVSKYVSRGGDKIESAVRILQLEDKIPHSIVLDVGSSTGGFTDFMLQMGASHIYACDVGTNQLDWSLRNDKRVSVYEQTDIRDFAAPVGVSFDWIVADISFQSLANILPAIIAMPMKSGAKLLLLIKPQFELSPHLVEDGGIVRDHGMRQQAVLNVEKTLRKLHFPLGVAVESAVKGSKGNQEIFYFIELP